MSDINCGHYGVGLARRTKRLWTDEEKRSICFQTAASGVSVAQVARCCAVNANIVFKWLRDPHYSLAREVSPADVPTFPSVEIADQHRLRCTNPVRDSSCESSVIAGGHEQTERPGPQDAEPAVV